MAPQSRISASHREIRRGAPVAVGGIVLTPVILYERHGVVGVPGGGFFAAQRPVAVIVAEPQGRRLIRLHERADGS